MKQFLKAFLPAPVRHAVREIRDISQIAFLEDRQFDPRNLRPANDIIVSSIFADAELARSWTEDQQAINALYSEKSLCGGVNPGDRRALYYLIRALKPLSVLEVGTHIGASTIHIARALKTNGQGRLTTVDIADVNDPQNGPWKKAGLSATPQSLMEKMGCADLVRFVARPSLQFMKNSPDKFDFIFLDGDHSAAAVYNEVAASLEIMVPGGIILLHDYYPQVYPLGGPFRALARIKKEKPEITVQPLGNLPWLTKDGANFTSLALVTRKA